MAKSAGPQLIVTNDEPSTDVLMRFAEWVGKAFLWLGGATTLVSAGLLFYMAITSSPNGAAETAGALANVGLLRNALLVGVVAVTAAITFLFWGEETVGPIQLIAAAILFCAPIYAPQIGGSSSPSEPQAAALAAIQFAGTIAGILAILAIAADVTSRIRVRVKQGSKADQLKFGKGVKEERDIHNVLLGKCWQLPFCRKFVRERCPIYHSKRTCWKERVGCMCEESVIRNAMEGKVIPRDMVAAAKFIPRNSTLSPEKKAERCRQCVIYNEHQKHKYKIAIPVILIGSGAAYVLGRDAMKQGLGSVVQRADTAMKDMAYGKGGFKEGMLGPDGKPMAGASWDNLGAFNDVLLVCLMLMVVAYVMKLAEFLFFKLKV